MPRACCLGMSPDYYRAQELWIIAVAERESVRKSNKPDISESLVIYGENLDAILDALDEEEDIQWPFEAKLHAKLI
eukprot:gene6765-12330_t